MISGAAFATVRSAIMISIMFLAVLLDRPALALRNVILTATLILVLFPESLFDVGFPDVVCRRAGARLHLRGAAHPRSVGAPDGAHCLAPRRLFCRHRVVDADRVRRRGAVRCLPFP
jgi:hypothetical protein